MADVLPRFLPVLLGGLAVAVKVALGAFALALVLGLALALLTRSPLRLLRIPAWGYIELIRGTPALTQLFMETYLSMQVYVLVAAIYLACTIPLAHLAGRLERRLGRGR